MEEIDNYWPLDEEDKCPKPVRIAILIALFAMVAKRVLDDLFFKL